MIRPLALALAFAALPAAAQAGGCLISAPDAGYRLCTEIDGLPAQTLEMFCQNQAANFTMGGQPGQMELRDTCPDNPDGVCESQTQHGTIAFHFYDYPAAALTKIRQECETEATWVQ